MKPILVHIHIYYADMWKELKACANNITASYNLYITMPDENKILRPDILQFKPDAHILIVENRGFDVGPFLHVLNKVNLDDYDYIIKLHTKRDWPLNTYLGKHNVSGRLWRKYCLSFLEQTNFEKCIAAFQARPQLGMVSNFRLILKKELYDIAAVDESRLLLKKAALPITPLTYIGGTMFMCRAGLLKAVQRLNITMDDFNGSDRSQHTSLAHTMERFLGWVINAQGYAIADPFTARPERLKALAAYFLRRLRLFFFKVKVGQDGRLSIKICKIPIRIKKN